MQTKLFTEL